MQFVLATNDKINLSSSHFGDSKFYLIYDIKETTLKLLKSVSNEYLNIDENTTHGAEKKRHSVLSLFPKSIAAIVAGQKSPNFVKISQKTNIVPVVVRSQNLDDILEILQSHLSIINQASKEKKIVVIKGVS